MSVPRNPARPLAIRVLDRFTTVMLLIALAALALGAMATRVGGIR